MQLPQSSSPSLAIRAASVAIFITLAAVMSEAAQQRGAPDQPVAQQLVCSPNVVTFGAVPVNQSLAKVISVTNTGQTGATISAVRVDNYEYKVSGLALPAVVAPGQTVNLSVAFSPTASGMSAAVVTFKSNASNSRLHLPLSGMAVASEVLSATPPSLFFGQVVVGNSSSLSLVLTNAGSASETLTGFQTTGTAYSVSGPALPLNLNPGQSVTLSVAFAPQSAGVIGGSVFIAGPSLSVPFTGTGATAVGQLSISPSGVSFGNVSMGTSATQTVNLNATGGPVIVSSAAITNSQFSLSGASLPMTIPVGRSAQLNVVFNPNSIGAASAVVSFASNASNANIGLPLAGTGVSNPVLSATPPSLSFGQVALGTSSSLPVVLTNTGASSETLTAFQTAGAGYSVSGPTLPVTVSPGQSVTLNVAFAPQAAGVIGGSVFVPGPSLNVPFTGTGTTTIGQLTIAPGTLNFGSVQMDTTATQATILSAAGGSVTVSSAASSNGQFALSGVSLPFTIGVGQSVQLNVAFTPNNAGSASGTLSFSSNASNPQATESLVGTGTAPHVSLTWSPSTSEVSGYNVYRGTAPGTYSKINTTVDSGTVYTDSTVVSGLTYYYAATAVDSSGQESSYSTPVAVTIP